MNEFCPREMKERSLAMSETLGDVTSTIINHKQFHKCLSHSLGGDLISTERSDLIKTEDCDGNQLCLLCETEAKRELRKMPTRH